MLSPVLLPRIIKTVSMLLLFGVASSAWAYGETDEDGRPSAHERALFVLTNQIRQAPHEWPDWDTSLSPGTKLKPLSGQTDLFGAARFHALDMAQNNHFAHESADGTPFSSRIQRFFSGASGENIYKSTRVDPYAAMTAWMNSEGHRTNILRPNWTWLGTGHSEESPYHYYVQNFGHNGDRQPETIPAAAAIWEKGTSLRLIANFYDGRGEPPVVLRAKIGDRCTELNRIAGDPGNGTYQSDQTEPSRCSKVVFWAQTANAPGMYRYPSTGAIQVGPGCSADFNADDTSTDCGATETNKIYIDAEETGCRCLNADREGDPRLLLLLAGLSLLGFLRQKVAT